MRFSVLLLAMVMMTMVPFGHGIPAQNLEAVENWFEKLPRANQKLTKLHFYLHNIVNGKTPTTVPVAQANITATSPTKFGLIDIMDAPLTVRPDPESELIGYAQGLFALSSQTEVSSLIALNFVFKNGEFNGSTLSTLGRNAVEEKYREFPIVGGSGVFRLAQGVGVVQTYSTDTATGNEILTCDFFVLSYDFGYADVE